MFVLEEQQQNTHIYSPTMSLSKLWKSAVGGLLIKTLGSECVFVWLAVFICADVRRIETRCWLSLRGQLELDRETRHVERASNHVGSKCHSL